jgi:hypothetical protein
MSFLDDASNADDNATVLPIEPQSQPVMYASIQGRVYEGSDESMDDITGLFRRNRAREQQAFMCIVNSWKSMFEL